MWEEGKSNKKRERLDMSPKKLERHQKDSPLERETQIQ